MARIIKLIYSEERVGNGTEANPTRMCPQLWSKNGNLVAYLDPKKDEASFYAENIFKQ